MKFRIKYIERFIKLSQNIEQSSPKPLIEFSLGPYIRATLFLHLINVGPYPTQYQLANLEYASVLFALDSERHHDLNGGDPDVSSKAQQGNKMSITRK